jgi:hypothetical protein
LGITNIALQTADVTGTTGFVPAAGVEKLPQLPRSGNLHSTAWMASNNSAFRAEMTALVQNAATMGAGPPVDIKSGATRRKGRHRRNATAANVNLAFCCFSHAA